MKTKHLPVFWNGLAAGIDKSRKDRRMKHVHVLVLAMSDLRNPLMTDKSGKETVLDHTYHFVDDVQSFQKEYRGIGQLEAIPRFIADYKNTDITHYIILETPETQKKLAYDFARINALYPEKIEIGADETLSAVEFFQKRIQSFHLSNDTAPLFIDVPLDMDHPEHGLQKALDHIRELYKTCMEENGEWQLWLDTHGAFREISMAMFSLMQVLSATAIDGVPKIADGQKIIEVDGVYTVRYNNDAQIQMIKDLTSFYRLYTLPVFKAYMNYGQYFLDVIAPYDGEHPYAFVSYRSTDAEKERYMILAMLKKAELLYWYDDGIHIHDDWEKTLEKKNEDCAVFIALLSENYFTSRQCMKELKRAVNAHKPIIFISLDETLPYISGEIRDPNEPDAILFTAEETAALSQKQHIYTYRKYIIDDVFQEWHMLRELMRENSILHLVHDDGSENIPVFEGERVFVNCTNHPSSRWSKEQLEEAEKMGRVVDIAFPNVDPHATEEEIRRLAEETTQSILHENPAAVLCQGEFTLTHALTAKLQEFGIPVYAACSERNVIEETDADGNTIRKTVFVFAGFRKYIA